MSKDWTDKELQAASAAMKAAGHMSYEEFCEELERQDMEVHTMTQLNRDEFNHALDDFLCRIRRRREWTSSVFSWTASGMQSGSWTASATSSQRTRMGFRWTRWRIKRFSPSSEGLFCCVYPPVSAANLCVDYSETRTGYSSSEELMYM